MITLLASKVIVMNRTQEQWKNLIKEQAKSSLTIKQFCIQQKTSTSAFYKNRHLLNQESLIDSPFSQIQLDTNLEPAIQEQPLTLTVGHANLTIPPNINSTWLANLLRQLA